MASLGDPDLDGDRDVLVFLNACQSASYTGLGEGVINFLLRRGFRNIIGSETLLPDLAASVFAMRFYDLLMRGKALGDALLSARQLMVQASGNPIGLLYCLFGDPMIRFSNQETRS
jgi:hypothetical protein